MQRFLSSTLPILILLVMVPTARAAAVEVLGLAAVAGVVSDDGGDPIPGVTVTVIRAGDAGSGELAITDVQGRFRVENLRPGTHSIRAELEGFQPVTTDLTLVPDQSVKVAFTLSFATFSDTVEVVAKAETFGEVAVLETRRQAATVSDSISAEEIRKTPDSNAASVVERLTGVTLLGNKYVFVRGLGERYSGTTINGAAIATTETEKRVVPLDLFPAKLLDRVNVVKTYTPDRPGDFGSGIVEMTTVDFPSTLILRLSLGAGHHSTATGSAFSRYASGLSTTGRGGQPLPSIIPSSALARRTALNSNGFTSEELEAFGEAFVGSWTGETISSASPAQDFSLTYGQTVGPLGIVLSGTSNHGYQVIEEEQRFFGLDSGGKLVPRNDYEMKTDREEATSGLVGNLSLRLSDHHRLQLHSVLTRDASAESRIQEGLNTNSGGDIRDYRVRYQMEEILSTRLSGEHRVAGPGMGSTLEWSLARSEATNDSDLRENLYRESSPGVYALQVGFPESGKIDVFTLDDSIDQGGLSWTLFHAAADGRRFGSIKLGADHLERARDFDARRFRFTTPNQLQFDLELSPEQIFTSENIRPGGFEIREVTGVNDAYDAGHTVDALYLMTDVTWGKWRLIGGARAEESSQSVLTFNPFDTNNQVESVREERDILPSLNLVYQVAPLSNLRFAYGRSLNRPEFRELSPFTFVEVTGGRSVAGNPDLRQATLDSLDLRWETFPRSGEVIAASLFYKRIDDPIEHIVQPTTELRSSFVNADAATLWGIEMEFRRSLDWISPRLERFSVNANYAWIHSDVTVGEQQLSVVTSLERPLEGQSDQVANVALQYLRPESGTMIRLLGSYIGERLTDVGAFGLPDIYETESAGLDLTFSQDLARLAPGLEIKISGTNLLDDARELTQGGEIQRRYEPGRKISLGLSYTPF